MLRDEGEGREEVGEIREDRERKEGGEGGRRRKAGCELLVTWLVGCIHQEGHLSKNR